VTNDRGAVLIVDDDPSVNASLTLLLKQEGYTPVAVTSPAEARAVLAGEHTPPIALVLSDMNFSRQTTGEEGLALLADIRRTRPRLPVVLMTAWGSIELAVQGMRAGAADFVTKPWTRAQLLQTVATALGLAAGAAAAPENPSRAALDARYQLDGLVGQAPRFLRCLELLGRVASTDASVLIMGESGTGKELVAEAIHRNSRRRGPFVKVNLGGISASLFESEMFGHVKGAFTDARQSRQGRFELADRGTIFLDEIGELEPMSQVKLLRVLQDRTFEVLGSSQPRTVDVRVVSATNRKLPEMVARGEFREDLLYRLNLITINLPPLRDRREDIPLLAGRFLAGGAAHYGREPLDLSRAAEDWLMEQPWPGNIRQLRQTMERALVLTSGSLLDVPDLESVGEAAPPAGDRPILPPVGAMTIDEIERAMIEKSLAHHQGNLSLVAGSLGLSRQALYRRLEKYGMKT
jgi:two-component system NtrC family response regulator